MRSKILNQETIEKIFENDTDWGLQVYQNAHQRQRDMIDTMIVNKLADGNTLNMNLVSAISSVSGKNLVEASEDLKANKIK